MNDVAKCDGEGCPKAVRCWRFVKSITGNRNHQKFVLSEWNDEKCDNYIPTSKRKEPDGENV